MGDKMLLRRVIEHVKTQNWLAIGIDFLIVVIGVFVGIQVSNWNADRLNRAAAVEYHARLVSDLEQEAMNFDFTQDYYRDVHAAAATTYAGLTDAQRVDDAALLVNAFRATQYIWFERYRSTYDELVSSGNLELIDDPQLRTSVSGFYAMELLEELNEEGRKSQFREAFRRLIAPDLLQALEEQCGDRQPSDAPIGVVSLSYECSFDWPAAEVQRGAATLRAERGLLPLLRLRIAELRGSDNSFDVNREVFGLGAFSQRIPTE